MILKMSYNGDPNSSYLLLSFSLGNDDVTNCAPTIFPARRAIFT